MADRSAAATGIEVYLSLLTIANQGFHAYDARIKCISRFPAAGGMTARIDEHDCSGINCLTDGYGVYKDVQGASVIMQI